MIVRIVKLTIQTEKAEQFKIFFHQSHFKIVNFKRWLHVELLQESLNKKFFLLTVFGIMKNVGRI